jgi:lysophospholipase L1-like esterase
MTTLKLIVACTLLAVMAAGARGSEANALPKPVPAPTIQPFVPVGEKLFYELSNTVIPGTRHWVMWQDGGLMHYNTTQSVGDGSAMYVYLPAGAKSGWLTAYDTGVQPVKNKEGQVTRDDLRQYKGLCLWIKGDGSDAAAVFTTNSGYSKNRFRVPLKDADWHKVFMPWDKWQEPITGYWWFLTYGLERSDRSRDNWYIVDRVHLYKEERTEPVQPTPDNDPPGMIPAKAFVSGREHIARTLAKLKARQPVKIVVAGDSIVTCAQLWYVRDDYTKPALDTYPYAYWWVLGQRLRDAYGYEKVGCVLRTWDDKEKKWKDTVAERPKADLQVIAVATGGWTAKLGLEHLGQVLGEKPDLVIWEYGANEGINGSLDQYVKCTEDAVNKLRAAGCEVVVQSMTTSADLFPKGWLKNTSIYEYLGELSKHSRRIAKEKNCALADMYAALSCRGIQFVGDLHSDFVHLNHYGHDMFADVLEGLLTDRDVRIWRYGPAARKAVGQSGP